MCGELLDHARPFHQRPGRRRLTDQPSSLWKWRAFRFLVHRANPSSDSNPTVVMNYATSPICHRSADCAIQGCGSDPGVFRVMSATAAPGQRDDRAVRIPPRKEALERARGDMTRGGIRHVRGRVSPRPIPLFARHVGTGMGCHERRDVKGLLIGQGSRIVERHVVTDERSPTFDPRQRRGNAERPLAPQCRRDGRPRAVGPVAARTGAGEDRASAGRGSPVSAGMSISFPGNGCCPPGTPRERNSR